MLKFENGEKSCEFENDSVILHDVIKSLGLDGKKIIAAKLNGEAMDLSRSVSSGGKVDAISADSPEGLEILRHSIPEHISE